MRPMRSAQIRGLLQAAVDRRVHLVARILRGLPETFLDLLADHLRDVRRLDVGKGAVRLRSNYFLRGRVHGGLVDEAEFAHAAQHVVAALRRALRIRDRVVTRRRLRHARQRRGLAERELVELFAEVGFRRRGDSVGALSEEDHVQVQREDFLLGEIAARGAA